MTMSRLQIAGSVNVEAQPTRSSTSALTAVQRERIGGRRRAAWGGKPEFVLAGPYEVRTRTPITPGRAIVWHQRRHSLEKVSTEWTVGAKSGARRASVQDIECARTCAKLGELMKFVSPSRPAFNVTVSRTALDAGSITTRNGTP